MAVVRTPRIGSPSCSMFVVSSSASTIYAAEPPQQLCRTAQLTAEKSQGRGSTAPGPVMIT
ncbi:hypothetical protein H8E07_00110 [bacterium]|nr:hypothetical protein [bacterium]